MSDGWTTRSRTFPDGRVETWLERPSPRTPGAVEEWHGDEAAAYANRSAPTTAVRSQRNATSARQRTKVVLADAVRPEIHRELAGWDGREMGGALVGRRKGDTIVVEHAGGLGLGVQPERGPYWLRPALTSYFDFALSYGMDLIGDWHSHANDAGIGASPADQKMWQRVRAALDAPAYVGVILSPAPAISLGLTAALDDETWAWTNTYFGVFVTTADGCESVPPPNN